MVNKAEKKVRKELAKQVIGALDAIEDKEDVRRKLRKYASELGFPEKTFECLSNERDLEDILRSAQEKIRKRQRARAPRSKTSAASSEAILPPSPASTSYAECQIDTGRSTSVVAAKAESPICDDAEAPNVMLSIYINDRSQWEVLNGCYGSSEHSYISALIVRRYGLKADAPGLNTVTMTWRDHRAKISRYPRTKFIIVADNDIAHDIIIGKSWDNVEEPISDGEGSNSEGNSPQHSEEEASDSELSGTEDEEDDPPGEDEEIDSTIGVEDEEVEEPSNSRSGSEVTSPEQSEAEADTNIYRPVTSPSSRIGMDPESLDFIAGVLLSMNKQRMKSKTQVSEIKEQKDLASPPARSKKRSPSTLEKTSIQLQPGISETSEAHRPTSRKIRLLKSSPHRKQVSSPISDPSVIPANSKVRRRSSSAQSAGGVDAPSKPKRKARLPNIQSDAESSRGESSKSKSHRPQKTTQQRLASDKRTRPRSPMATSSSQSAKTRRAKPGSSEYG